MKGFIKKIEQINFGLMSPEDIRAMSVVAVETPDTYEDDGFPIDKGLMDPRMGVIDPSLVCTTCGFRGGDCQGHFGHIELARPVIHAGFADVIFKMLRSTCNECGRILLNDEQIKDFTERIQKAHANQKNLDNILKEVYRRSRRELRHMPEYYEKVDPKYCCPHCGAPQEAIFLYYPYNIQQGRYGLTDSQVRERLEKITDEDSFVLGVNPNVARPEWMVLTALPVPPVTVRPSITIESGERAEDDLTHKLVDILRINQRLIENIEAAAPPLIVDDLWELLRYHISTYFDNKNLRLPPARHRSGRPLITLMERLNGHEKDAMHDKSRGRFRDNLSGKRVNFSARTVMSPDPNIGINEIGVPQMIAKMVTVPVYVTQWNIDEMKEYIKNGPDVHPGATYVIRNDGRKIRVRNEETVDLILQQLEPGFIVERHLKDGDITLLNRQPSLHKSSLLAHEVKILPYKTFRLNPAVCPPYNVDFDGDEMNLHVLQTVESRAEAKSLMLVQDNMRSPRFGGPLIGAIRDHISGAYLLTKSGTTFSEEEALQIIRKSRLKLPESEGDIWVLKTDIALKPNSKFSGDIKSSYIYKSKGERWTGKELFSLLLPNDLNMSFSAEISKSPIVYHPEDSTVVIKNGILISGVIDESAIGSIKGQLLDKIFMDYGPGQAKDFLEKATLLSLCALMKIGISNSINDYEIPKEAYDKINEHLDKKISEVDKIVESYEGGYLKSLPGKTLKQTLDMKISHVLKEARDMAGAIAENYFKLPSENLPFSSFGRHSSVMAHTGAKSSMLNITQISACVGQQSIRGQSLNNVFNNRGYDKRLMPHFKKGELNAKSGGFVKSSYLKGLDPMEFFMHAMGGRDSLVDKSIRISVSGYMQRRLVNALQDLQTDEKGMVKDTKGNVIQFLYGEDGVDPVKTDFGKPVDLDKLIDEMRMETLDIKKSNFSDSENDDKSEQNPYENLSERQIKKLEIRTRYLSNKIKHTISSYSDFIIKSKYKMEQIDEEYWKFDIKQLIPKLERKYDSLINYQKQCDNFELHDEISVAINDVDNDLKIYKSELGEILSETRRFRFYSVEYNTLISKAKHSFDEKFNIYLELNSKFSNLLDNATKIRDFIHENQFFADLDDISVELNQKSNELNFINDSLNELSFDKGSDFLQLSEEINTLHNLIAKIKEIDLETLQKSISEQENKYKIFNRSFTEVKTLEFNIAKYDELMDEAKFLLDYKLNICSEFHSKLNVIFYNSKNIEDNIDIKEFLNDLRKTQHKLDQCHEKLKIINFQIDKNNLNESTSIPILIKKINEIDKLIGEITKINFEYIEKNIIEYENFYKNSINNEINSESLEEILNEFEKCFNRPIFKRQLRKYNLDGNELDIIKKGIKDDIINHVITGEDIDFKGIIKTRCEEFRENNSEVDESEIDVLLDNSTFSDVDDDIVIECKNNVKRDYLEGNITINQVELKLNNYINKKINESIQLKELDRIKNNPNVPNIKIHLTQEENDEIYRITKTEILSINGIRGNVENRVYYWVNQKIRDNQSEARGRLNSLKRDFSNLTQLSKKQQSEFVYQIELYIYENKLKPYDITEENIIRFSEYFKNDGKLNL